MSMIFALLLGVGAIMVATRVVLADEYEQLEVRVNLVKDCFIVKNDMKDFQEAINDPQIRKLLRTLDLNSVSRAADRE